RQVVRARRAELQAVQNDSVLAVAEAYLGVQQARGELAGAIDAQQRGEELVRRTVKLKCLVAPVDEVRARADLARRKQAVAAARRRIPRARWRPVPSAAAATTGSAISAAASITMFRSCGSCKTLASATMPASRSGKRKINSPSSSCFARKTSSPPRSSRHTPR